MYCEGCGKVFEEEIGYCFHCGCSDWSDVERPQKTNAEILEQSKLMQMAKTLWNANTSGGEEFDWLGLTYSLMCELLKSFFEFNPPQDCKIPLIAIHGYFTAKSKEECESYVMNYGNDVNEAMKDALLHVENFSNENPNDTVSKLLCIFFLWNIIGFKTDDFILEEMLSILYMEDEGMGTEKIGIAFCSFACLIGFRNW